MGLFGKKYKCQTCGAKFDSEGRPMERANMHSQASSQQAADTFKCAKCGTTFTSEAHLDEHTKKAHLDFADVASSRD